jgi:superfamily II DNA or RNA helicase
MPFAKLRLHGKVCDFIIKYMPKKTITVILDSHLVIHRTDLPEDVKRAIYTRLTWENPEYKTAQFRRGRTDKIEPYITAVQMVGNRYLLPREFWPEFLAICERNNVNVEIQDRTVINEARPLEIRFTPWKSQKRAIKKLLDNKMGHQGILKAPCGSGKTNILLYVAAKLGQNTLVLAHTNDLIHQWQQRVKSLLGVKAGIVQGNTVDLQQITIASVMTLAQRNMSEEFLNRWGCVILDEAHHCPAQSFKDVMTQFPAYFRFGATATPTRSDELEGLLFAVCGDIVAEITYDQLEEEGVIVRPEVEIHETGFKFSYYGSVKNNPRVWHSLVKKVVTSKQRNHYIARQIVEDANAGASVQLVLSKQIDHLRYLRRAVEREQPGLKTALLIAGSRSKGVFTTKEERNDIIERARRGNIRVLFGTSLADEGLDIQRLDRLHLTFPTRADAKVEQQVGRIQRAYPGKHTAVVHDYVDDISLLRNQASDRRKVYRTMGLKVKRV